MIEENMEDKDGRKRTKPNILIELAPYTTLGIQLVLTIVIGAYFGWWLDGKYGSSPVFLIIFTFLGAIAGMVSFIRTVTKKNKKKN